MNDGGGIEILGWYEYFCKSSGFGGLNNIDNAVNRAYFATERQFADKDFLTYIRGGELSTGNKNRDCNGKIER